MCTYGFLNFSKLIIEIGVLWILPSGSKKIRNYPDCYSFMTSLKTYVNVPIGKVINKKLGRKNILFVSILKVTEEKWSADPDLQLKATDPEHWLRYLYEKFLLHPRNYTY